MNEWVPYGKLALVANTVCEPRISTIPTCETFDSEKLTEPGLRTRRWVVRIDSVGGVVR